MKSKSLQEKYGFGKEQELSIDQALNIVHKEADKTEAELRREAEKIEYEPTIMTSNMREEYLNYCLSLCKGRPNFIAILRIKIGMASHPEFGDLNETQKNIEISKELKKYGIHVSFRDVEKLETDAIKFVQDEISRIQNTQLPVVGGL